LVSQSSSALLTEVADKTRLTRSLAVALGEPRLRPSSHGRGCVIAIWR